MRALVIGASGFVGGHLSRVLSLDGQQVWGTYCRHCRPGLLPLDVRDRGATKALLAVVKPDLVYHPAAVPDVEWCESFPEESYQINVVGLGHVLEAAAAVDARVVTFSSEYVFDGTGGPYAEESEPNPLSVYGRQKLAGEELARTRAPTALILRTTVVFGWEQRVRNFAARLIAELKAGRPVRAPEDQVSSPTYVTDLVRAAAGLALRRVSGLYHVAGSERVDRYTFARAVAETFGLDGSLIVPVLTADLGQKARRPLSAGLRVEKVRRELGWMPAGYRAGLTRMKEEKEREEEEG